MSNRVKLEIDSSIIERNLDFRIKPENEVDDDPLSRLFPRSKPNSDEIPWKLVVPKPGFVVKCRTTENDKIFVNVCHCLDVPAPRDISETELLELLDSDDPTSYTVPMSIGDLHVECDKSGNLASAYDIAINTAFYNKLKESELFKNFFLTVILEGIENKYKVQLDRTANPVILKNRKCFGSLRSHRIEQRPVRSAPGKLIQELPDVPESSTSFKNTTSAGKPVKKLIEELPESSLSTVNCLQTDSPTKNDNINVKELKLPINGGNKVKLIRTPKDGPVESMIAFISISALSGKELELDVGEDRILVNSPQKHVMMDFFLPYNVDRDNVTAKYLVNTQTLRVDMPVKQ